MCPHRDAVQGKLPPEEAQGVLANTQGAVGAAAGTLGGTLKGVVDTTGNTVGSLAQGLQGTVQGVGDGVGSTVQFAGGAVGSGVSQVGNYVTGSKSKDNLKDRTGSIAESNTPLEREKAERKILPDAYKGSKDSTQTISDTSKAAEEKDQ